MWGESLHSRIVEITADPEKYFGYRFPTGINRLQTGAAQIKEEVTLEGTVDSPTAGHHLLYPQFVVTV